MWKKQDSLHTAGSVLRLLQLVVSACDADGELLESHPPHQSFLSQQQQMQQIHPESGVVWLPCVHLLPCEDSQLLSVFGSIHIETYKDNHISKFERLILCNIPHTFEEAPDSFP
jgi:hypothetical protein